MAVWILGIPDLEKNMSPEDVNKYRRIVDDIKYLSQYVNEIRICLIVLTITVPLALFVYLVRKCLASTKRKPLPKVTYTPPPMARSRSISDYQMDKNNYQISTLIPDRPMIQIPETRIQMSATCHDFGMITSHPKDANMNTLDTFLPNPPGQYRRRPSSMRRKSFIGNHVGHQRERSSDGSTEIQLDIPTMSTSLGSEP